MSSNRRFFALMEACIIGNSSVLMFVVPRMWIVEARSAKHHNTRGAKIQKKAGAAEFSFTPAQGSLL